MNRLFTARQDLRIGRIIEVSGNGLRIELANSISELTRSVDGCIYPVGQIASIIKVHFGRRILFAYVRSLRMRSDILSEEGKTSILPGDDTRILEADLFGQGTWNQKRAELSFTRGVETYPLPLQDAFICLNEELECVYNAAESSAEAKSINPMVPIGNYIGSNNAICRANIDKLFGHHCAILGSTGSGKSGTVAAVLHAVLAHKHDGQPIRPRIIIIDPHSEYASAFGNKAQVYRAYNEASAGENLSEQLKLPYWLMSSDEFRSLVIGKTEEEATAQNNMVYKAISYARMFQAGLVENVGDDAEGGGELKPKEGIDQSVIIGFDRDKPIPFSLVEFEKHIDKIQGRKDGKRENLAPSSSERGRVDSILKKVKVLRGNPQLSFIMDELSIGSPTLEAVISQFVGEASGKDVKIIDISGLPNEVAGPLTALIARLLFQYKVWQTSDERKADPILFVCEEAHRYVPNHGEAQYREAQQAIRRIAKEGRKYGLGLMLVSQRPADVEATVLSQCNSWIVLRLTNSADQEHVAKFLPDSLIGLTKMLPSLTRREAIFVGEAAALPSRVRISKLSKEQLPDSHDISFANGWMTPPKSIESLKVISGRWVGAGSK